MVVHVGAGLADQAQEARLHTGRKGSRTETAGADLQLAWFARHGRGLVKGSRVSPCGALKRAVDSHYDLRIYAIVPVLPLGISVIY